MKTNELKQKVCSACKSEAVAARVANWINENHYTRAGVYNYYENMAADLLDVIADGLSYSGLQYYEDMYEGLWLDDSVTGNGSGSYTFDSWTSAENVAHNWDLLREALEAFGGGFDVLERGAEFADVSIRCYILAEVLTKVTDIIAKYLGFVSWDAMADEYQTAEAAEVAEA